MGFWENIPFIIFNIAFFAILVAFVFGAFALFFRRREDIILKSLYALLVLLLVALVFFGVSYLVKKGQALKPAPASKEFPKPPFSIFPPCLVCGTGSENDIINNND